MEDYQQLYREYFYYIIIGQLLVGLIFGLIPFLLGVKRGKRNLGLIGLAASVITAVISPIISIIVAIIFTVLVIRKSGTEPPVVNSDNQPL